MIAPARDGTLRVLRAAWDFMAGQATEFTTILPGAVFGPVLMNDNRGSVQLIGGLLQGRPPGLPRLGFWIVDVRDLADLHIRAMTSAAAAGQRFIAANDFMWMEDLAKSLRSGLGSRAAKVPTRARIRPASGDNHGCRMCREPAERTRLVVGRLVVGVGIVVESRQCRTTTSTHNEPGAVMRYACLVYFDPKTMFSQSAAANAVLAETGPYNNELTASGHRLTGEALVLPDEAVTVRIRDGKMSATDGPFMETKEVLGGFLMIEARDLEEAVQVAARNPMARLGSIEVRPVVDFSKPRPKL